MSKILIELFKSIPKEKAAESLRLMYDSFVRDDLSGEYSHEVRVQALDVYRALEEEINRLKED